MREHSLEAYHEGMKFEKSLVERRRKDGVGEEREGRETCLPTMEEREVDKGNEIRERNIIIFFLKKLN
jgi:hypothetical protein